MTDQQIDEFLEMLAKSPTNARDMVRGLFAKAAPAVPQGAIYEMADALYKRGYTDLQSGKDYDPRGCDEWQEVVDWLTPAAPSQEPDNCRKRPRCGLDDPCAWTTKREPSQESVTDEVLESLRECVNSLWVIDSHVVEFDGTVHFGPYYDFSGLDGIDRHEFLAEHSCVVWPSGGKWSAYCTYDGTTWFELFDSADAAKEKCMGLLDRVMPAHPAMKARAIIAALREKQAKDTP